MGEESIDKGGYIIIRDIAYHYKDSIIGYLLGKGAIKPTGFMRYYVLVENDTHQFTREEISILVSRELSM